MTNISPLPTFTDTVDQRFFIESQGGAQNPISLLDRFPDSIYSKSIDSALVKFLYALLGPVGVGQLRQEYLEARLMFEDANLSVFDLDALYTNPFAFARLADETYNFDASAALLSASDRARILASDASFRNRAIDYFKGVRAGGTLRGLSLIAKSGLNRPVELIENYRALYDQYADIPLGLPFMGSTVDANEVIVLPRQNIPQNATQMLTFTGDPTSGTFTLLLVMDATNTTALPYNATAMAVQNALQALPMINGNNVAVSGGPLPSHPLTIQFCNALGDQPIPALLVTSSMADVLGLTATVIATITVMTPGTSANSQTSPIRSADEHAMQIGLDNVRPQTVFFTTQPASSISQQQPVNTIFAGATYAEVLRYEVGNSRATWSIDSLHWLQGGIEREAPRPVGDLKHHYQGFHNILNLTAYNEDALSDPGYGSGVDLTKYWNTMIGQFSPVQIALYPFLANYRDDSAQYLPALAVAPTAEPLVITQTVGGVGLINDIYPVDYMNSSGRALPGQQSFWSSMERAPMTSAPSVDYLEIDLGHPYAVNYIYFEATRKPYLISVDYDLLDQSPTRLFTPITQASNPGSPSTMGLDYDATATNPWTIVEIHCVNPLEQMIYTRFIRLGFTRNPAFSPFAPPGLPIIPYSIEVKNLRVGRNIL